MPTEIRFIGDSREDIRAQAAEFFGFEFDAESEPQSTDLSTPPKNKGGRPKKNAAPAAGAPPATATPTSVATPLPAGGAPATSAPPGGAVAAPNSPELTSLRDALARLQKASNYKTMVAFFQSKTGYQASSDVPAAQIPQVIALLDAETARLTNPAPATPAAGEGMI